NKKIRLRFSINFRAFPDPTRAVFAFQDVSEQYQLEQNLRDNANFFETLLDTVPVPVFYKDTEGKYLGANATFLDSIGIRKQDILGKTVEDLPILRDGGLFAQIDDELFASGGGRTYKSDITFPDASQRTILFNKKAYRDSQGNIAGLIGSMTDITDQAKQTMHLYTTNSRLRAILESTVDGILMIDRHYKVRHFNQEFVELFQVPETLLAEQDIVPILQFIRDKMSNPEKFATISELDQRNGEYAQFDTLNCQDGRIIEQYSRVLSHSGGSFGRIWSFRDVTQLRQSEAALQQKELQLRDIVDNANQAIFVVDLATMKPVSCNPRALEMFSYPTEETFFALNPEDINGPMQPGGISRAEYLEQLLAELTSPHMYRLSYEAIGQRLDGNTFPKKVEVVKTQYQDTPALLFFVTDTSAQTAAEEQMRLHSQVIDTWITKTPTIYYRFTKEGIFIESVGTPLARLGLSPGEVVGKNLFELYADFPEIIDAHHRAINGEFVTYSSSVPALDGMAHFEVTVFYDPGSKVGVGLSLDVTDRIITAKALRESEERFRKLFEHSPFGIAIRDMEANKLVDVNPRFADMVGYLPHEIEEQERGKFTAWEDQNLLDQGLSKLISGEIPTFVAEKVYQRKDGSSFWARIQRGLVELNQKTYLIGFIEDIDARRQAEAALRESEARYRLLFEHAFDGILIIDANTLRGIDCNQKMLQYFGIPDKETMLESSLLEYAPLKQPGGRPSRDMLKEYIDQGLRDGTIAYEWLHQRKNGTQMHTYIYAIRYQSTQNDLYMVLFQDITPKKEQEQIIRDQMDRLSIKTAELERYIDSNMQLENFA
ncbi:MAG: PAS domain S-box protein, partial [Bacteroidota bacterium]